MHRSRNVALMFLLGAVLVGGVLGFTVDRVMVKDRLCVSRGSTGDWRKSMYDDLSLNQDQRIAFDSLISERGRKISALYTPLRVQEDSIRAAYREQLFSLLTPAQLAANERREQEIKARRQKTSEK